MPNTQERTIEFEVEDIKCAACVGIIENMLTHDDPALKVKVILLDKKVQVTVPALPTKTDDEWLAVFAAKLKDVDMKVTLPEKKAAHAQTPSKKLSPKTWNILKGTLGLGVGVLLLALSASGFAIPAALMFSLAIGATGLIAFLGFDTYRAAFKEFIHTKTLTMEALLTISILAAVISSIASLFVPWMPMMFDSALIILGFKFTGDVIKDAIKHQVVKGTKFRERIPKYILCVKEKEEELIAVSRLKPGDKIRIKSGEYIPVDGRLDDEESEVFETIMNGKPYPTMIQKNHMLLAGMSVPKHVDSMVMTVTKAELDSNLAQKDKYLSEVKEEEAKIEIQAKKFLQKVFVPGVLILAGLCLVVGGYFSGIAVGIERAVTALVIACPCTLGLIIPLALRIGMNKARLHGVEFKGTKALQQAANVDAMVFDVNGTLTEGVPKVTRLMPVNQKISEKEALKYLHALEAYSQKKHATAEAILSYAEGRLREDEKIKSASVKFDDKKFTSGVRALIDGSWYTVGNLNMLRQNGVDVSPFLHEGRGIDQRIFLAKDKEVICQAVLTDPLRLDAKNVIEALKKKYKKICLCTGADKETALQFASMFSIPKEEVHAECTAQDKIKVVQKLKDQGYYPAFVGDAGNDVLASKNCFGIAVYSSSADAVMRDQALAVVSSNSLLPLLTIYEVAKQTKTNINQNLIASMAYNALALGAAISFVLNPAIGAFLMLAQACLVLLNASAFMHKSIPGLEAQMVNKSQIEGTNTLNINHSIKQVVTLKKTKNEVKEPPKTMVLPACECDLNEKIEKTTPSLRLS